MLLAQHARSRGYASFEPGGGFAQDFAALRRRAAPPRIERASRPLQRLVDVRRTRDVHEADLSLRGGIDHAQGVATLAAGPSAGQEQGVFVHDGSLRKKARGRDRPTTGMSFSFVAKFWRMRNDIPQ
ncbi:MAG: hypothetical protein OJF60_002806 [Burkholderiaceae bacterium]|nr:MAG: hypothetical protein OJF60_002806 [Burkholderiaceae bacterium]